MTESVKLEQAFDLWFFRELSDDQRKSLFALAYGSPIADEAKNHGLQRVILKRFKQDLRHQPQEREAVQPCDIAWLWSLHTKAQSEGSEGDRRKLSRIIAALTTPAPAAEREAVLEEIYDKLRGTNADLCKTPGAAYRLMLEAIHTLKATPASTSERNVILEEAARFVEQRIGDTFLLAEELRALKTTPAPPSEREAVLDEAVVRTFAEGLWAEARKRGEMRPAYMPPSRTDFLDKARNQLAALTTLAPAAATDDLWNPPEHAWDGLARQLVMWLDMGDKTPRALFEHLERTGCEIPQWLRDEPELQHLDHVPSKGTRAVIIYRAILSRLRGEGE